MYLCVKQEPSQFIWYADVEDHYQATHNSEDQYCIDNEFSI